MLALLCFHFQRREKKTEKRTGTEVERVAMVHPAPPLTVGPPQSFVPSQDL